MCRLLENFWSHQQVVPKQNGYHGPALPATQVTMQVSFLSPTLFNVDVDNLIRTWLAMTVEDQRVAHYGLEEAVGRCLVFSTMMTAWLDTDNLIGYNT